MFISYSSGGWEIQDQSSHRFGVWRGPTLWLLDGCLLTVTSCGGGSEGYLWGLFYRER